MHKHIFYKIKCTVPKYEGPPEDKERLCIAFPFALVQTLEANVGYDTLQYKLSNPAMR